MAAPRELSLEAIRIYMLENGGKVTNHDLVKHFKRFLTNPETRDEARNQFKEYVNTLATIRNEEGEKCLVLKKRFRPGLPVSGDFPSPSHTPSPSSSFAPPPYTPPPPASLSPCSPRPTPSPLSVSCESLSPGRLPPPYRPPPPPAPAPPTAPPRRRSSSERLGMAEAGAAAPLPSAGEGVKRHKAMGGEAPAEGASAPAAGDAAVSVKERTQRFQRMASEGDLLRAAPAPAPGALLPLPLGLRNGKCTNDDTGDAVSVSMLDTRAREWLVRAAQADHLRLTKLATEDSRLARLRDPTSTALHWAAKYGNEHIVKLIAGTHKGDVNARTGYTPAHIAMQFNRENIFSLLVEVYGADPNLRDWSGKKPRQYLTNQDTTVSADTFRKIKARKKQTEKDLGFLRIGSLNMRVKRTTEAFSNFLGVGTTNNDKVHKSWGSADNIQQVDRHIMPPPKTGPIKKRGSRRGIQDYSGSHSTPSTPPSHSRAAHDSDSDTAAGFGSDWQGS